jgi:hypothetical protein
VTISGGLRFPTDGRTGFSHISTSGSDLILSASTSSVAVSGVLRVLPMTDGNAKIRMVGDPTTGQGLIQFNGNNKIMFMPDSDTIQIPVWLYYAKDCFPFNTGSHFILSSSRGSTMAMSGAVKIKDPNNLNYSINASDSHLILSSSIGSKVYISGILATSGGLDLTGSVFLNDELIFTKDANANSSHIYASASDLILSSSTNSRVVISGVLLFPTDARPGLSHISTSGSDLILSSSTSHVIISGGLRFPLDGRAGFAHISTSGSDLILSASNSSVVLSSSLNIVNANNKNYSIKCTDGDLILSTSKGNGNIYTSGNFKASGSIQSLGGYYYGIGTNTDLYLSSEIITFYANGTNAAAVHSTRN